MKKVTTLQSLDQLGATQFAKDLGYDYQAELRKTKKAKISEDIEFLNKKLKMYDNAYTIIFGIQRRYPEVEVGISQLQITIQDLISKGKLHRSEDLALGMLKSKNSYAESLRELKDSCTEIEDKLYELHNA